MTSLNTMIAQPPPAFGALAAEGRDRLHIFRDGFIFTSPWVCTARTTRYPAVLLLSLDGITPFVLDAGSMARPVMAAAVAPHVARGLDARRTRLMSLNIEPSHPLFGHFRQVGGCGIQVLDRRVFNDFNGEMEACYHGRLGLDEAESLFDRLLACAVAALPPARPRDVRISRLLTVLGENPFMSLTQLAGVLGLSYNRLSHLFSAEVGVSLRGYQRWVKVRQASLQMNSGLLLTDIAQHAGFSDSAHLARTFQQMYGIRPSYILDNQCMQVVY